MTRSEFSANLELALITTPSWQLPSSTRRAKRLSMLRRVLRAILGR